ncbi:MAG: hypothetical protein HY455_00345 [Parcubacteria group bacterium]|nr:hypothetical protein [Parcubacteria group bacterium]
MIYVFWGSDTARVAEKSSAFVDALRAKKPEAPILVFDEETVSVSSLEELVRAHGLFESNNIVVLSNTLSLEPIAEFVEEEVAQLADSATVFVFKEAKLSATLKRVLAKYAKKAFLLEKPEQKQRKDTITFELSDALGARNRQEAWVLLQKALRGGHEPEQIHGTLFWQVKNLLSLTQAEQEGPAAITALGLNPFVEKKAKQFKKNFSETELQKLSSTLVSISHEARLGGEDLDVALERFVLNI